MTRAVTAWLATLFLALAFPFAAIAQTVQVRDPSTGLPVFSAANPAPISVVNGTSAITVQSSPPANTWNYAAATGGIVNTTTAVTIKAAAGASIRNYLCNLQISHDALGAVTEFAVRDGAAGTVIWRGRLQVTATDISAGAGAMVFSPCLRGTANTLLEVVTLTAVTGGVWVDAQGYTGS